MQEKLVFTVAGLVAQPPAPLVAWKVVAKLEKLEAIYGGGVKFPRSAKHCPFTTRQSPVGVDVVSEEEPVYGVEESVFFVDAIEPLPIFIGCLLYTSDAADD